MYTLYSRRQNKRIQSLNFFLLLLEIIHIRSPHKHIFVIIQREILLKLI